MKNLLQTHSLSWAESVTIALEAEGIEAVILDPQAPGYLGFAGRIRVAVVNDEDFPRAHAVLLQLEPPHTPPPPSWRWQKAGLVSLGVGILLLFAWGSVVERLGRGAIATGIIVTSIVLLVAGIALVALGPLADREAGSTRGPPPRR